MDTRRSFHRELQSIRDDLVRLAAMVTGSITGGTQALLDGDPSAAHDLVAADVGEKVRYLVSGRLPSASPAVPG